MRALHIEINRYKNMYTNTTKTNKKFSMRNERHKSKHTSHELTTRLQSKHPTTNQFCPQVILRKKQQETSNIRKAKERNIMCNTHMLQSKICNLWNKIHSQNSLTVKTHKKNVYFWFMRIRFSAYWTYWHQCFALAKNTCCLRYKQIGMTVAMENTKERNQNHFGNISKNVIHPQCLPNTKRNV